MRICLLFALLFSFCFGLNLNEAISLALKNSQRIQEEEFNVKKVQNTKRAQYGNFAPKLELRYSITQNTRINGDIITTNLSDIHASYNLFNGLKDFYSLKRYESLESAQHYLSEATRQDIILLAKTFYIQILEARDNLAISTESIRLLELQRTQAEDFYLQGLKAKSDLLSVEVMLANAKVTQSNDKNALQYALLSLQKLLNQNIALDSLESLRPQDLNALNFERAQLEDLMLRSRSEYLYLHSLLDSLQYEKRIAQGAYLPKFDATFSRLWYSNDVSTLNRLGTNLQSQAKFSVTWNVFNGLSDRYVIESKHFEILSTQSRLVDLKRELNLALDKALSDLSIAKEQYEVSKNAVSLAEESYKIVQNRYKQNIETSRELLNSEVALSQARLHFNQSEHRINLALANLERIVQDSLNKI